MEATRFVFNENIVRRHIPDTVLLNALRRFAKTCPRARPARKDFDKWPGRPCSSNVYYSRFGSWRDALRKCGVHYSRIGRLTPDELMLVLERVWRKIGRAPGHAPLWKFGRVSGQCYITHWGTLKHARDLLARYKRREITRAELLAPVPPSAFNRHSVRPGVRYKILKRDHHRCQLCGRSPKSDPDIILEIDHILPASKGGTEDPTNLRTLCRQCNRGKCATLEPQAA